MRFTSVILLTIMVAMCRGYDGYHDECLPGACDPGDVDCVLTRFKTATQCYFAKALYDATSTAKLIGGMVRKSGKTAMKYFGSQVLMKLMDRDADLTTTRSALSEQIPEKFELAWIGDVKFVGDVIKVTGDYLTKHEVNESLPEVSVGNILWTVEKMQSYHDNRFYDWAEHFAREIHAVVTNPDHELSFQPALDGMMKLIPDSIVNFMKAKWSEFMGSRREKREATTDMEKFNQKALDIFKIISCNILMSTGYPSLCSQVVSMWDLIAEEIASASQREGRSISDMSVTESIFHNLKDFPVHFYLDSTLKDGSDPGDLASVGLQITPVLKREVTEKGKGFSGRTKVMENRIDLVLLLRLIDHLQIYLRDILSETGCICVKILRSIAKLRNRSIEPFSEDTDNSTNKSKRSATAFLDLAKFMMGCMNTDWLDKKTSSSKILRGPFDSSSPRYGLPFEEKVGKYLDSLKIRKNREEFISAVSAQVKSHLNSKAENLKLAPHVETYLNCLEFVYGRFSSWPVLEELPGITLIRPYTVQIFSEWDHHFSALSKKFADMDPENKTLLVEENLGNMVEVVLDVWRAYQNTRSNPMCFASHLCLYSEQQAETPEPYPKLTEITGLFMEVIRSLEDRNSQNFPEIVDIFLNSAEACEKIPESVCSGGGSTHRILYTFFKRVLPEAMMVSLYP